MPSFSPIGREPGRQRIAENLLTTGYLAAAAALLIWAAWRRFQLPQAPYIDPDTAGYLGPAIAALAGKGFPHIDGRSFPYPAFVYLILRLFGDFRAISVVQHLMGIAAGGLILLAWNTAAAMVPEGGIQRSVVRFIGLLPAYLYLGSATAIEFDQSIRPEAVFPFLAILNIWVSFLFLDARFIRPKPSSVWLGALNVFISALMYMAKPSFGFGTLFCTLPVWLSLFLPGFTVAQKGALASASILPAFVLLILPEHFLKTRDPMAAEFLPESLLSAHAVLIQKQMTEDLAGTGSLPFPRPTVQAAHDLLGAELAKAPQIIGPQEKSHSSYKADYLLLEYIMYGDSFCKKFPAEMYLTPKGMADFCMTYYLRTLLHNPGGMAAKVRGQLSLFYTRKNPAYWAGPTLDISHAQYARTAFYMPQISQLGPGNPAVDRYVEASRQLAGKGIGIRQGHRFVKWLQFFADAYLVLLGFALLSPLLLLFRPLRDHFLWLVVALWLAYSYNFGNSLTIAIVHSMEVNRYVRIQLIFTIFSECLTLYLLLELAVRGIRAIMRGRASVPA